MSNALILLGLIWGTMLVFWIEHLYKTRQIIIDERVGTPYLIRYFLYKPKTKGKGRIYIHHIMRSDYDRALHDHPWSFKSVLLWGGYREHTTYTDMEYRPVRGKWKPTFFNASSDEALHCDFNAPCVLLRPAAWRHRLDLRDNKPVWSLVFTGPKERSWGFWTTLRDFCPWKKYDGRTGICDDYEE